MAINSRLKRLKVDPFPTTITVPDIKIADKIRSFYGELAKLLPGSEES